MAEGGGLLDQDKFSCVICLDLLKDPVTIPCGHRVCMGCIKGCWDQDDHTGVYSCPQCRETITPRHVLGRNTMLAEVVEKLKKTGLQAAPPAHCFTGPGDVVCDFCAGRKRKAVKSCLVCLASYCETHLQPHYESPAFKKHKLDKATGNLQEKICSHHDKLLEVYCRTDQQCICYLCTMDEHRGHDTVSAAAERTQKQDQLGVTRSKFQQRIQEREKELQDLRQAVQSLKAAAEDSDSIIIMLICSIERRRSELGADQPLEQEHIQRLQDLRDNIIATPELDEFSVAVRNAITGLKENLDNCKTELLRLFITVENIHGEEPRTRQDFLRHSRRLTLDPNTAHRDLHLSEGNTKVTRVSERHTHLLIQTDLSTGPKCCAASLCLFAVTGRLSGVGTCLL
ncbi:E3 ubiquitin/ISG15 ligase TRIM25-like isoform X23 [Anguilla rostrata]|uniref:E3 ubiquitin/ISG15 ligase TRIM25-like isoform X23 n=1 Tax=Anguilla rostrata TaxID=7938 RepID=UPI0030CE9078